MEYYVNTFFLVFFVTIVFSNPSPRTIAAANIEPEAGVKGEKLIPTACQHAVKKGFCNAMLESDPNANDADLHRFGLIALRQAATNASDISEHVKTLLNDHTVNAEVQDGAAECLELYLDAAEQLDDSVAALENKNYKDINTWVNVAITDSKSCDAALTGHEKVLGEKNEVFRWLCENALAVTKVLADQKQ